ncbi:hypothetical protein KIN20_000349 [Parelaphostrongylus tenuis]|uniref:Uncharacterized protein n=1 Tax=Parelaphostrongylus tenuis TaxID=148309 RepID=A0AAD5QBS4_PARTN|nr:hypothetical protein KIN20_000349 [Parelaphostrongylus tenuis]
MKKFSSSNLKEKLSTSPRGEVRYNPIRKNKMLASHQIADACESQGDFPLYGLISEQLQLLV